jgi:beta-glucosidase-like glycosyl hydrolase
MCVCTDITMVEHATDNQRRDYLNNAMGRSFQDRQQASLEAKTKMLERFKARPAEDDPTLARQRAERQAIVDARNAREAIKEAEKEAARIAAAEKAATEKAEREEAERIAAEAREVARVAEEARLAAERPRKSLMDAVQYMQQRAAGKGRR